MNGLPIPAHRLGGTTIANAGTAYEIGLQVAAHAPDPDHKIDGVIPFVVTRGNEAPGTSGDGSTITLYTNKQALSVGDATKFTIHIGIGNTLKSSGTATSATVSGRKITLTHDLTVEDKHKVLLQLAAGALEDNVGNGNTAGVPVFVHNNVAQTSHPSAVRSLRAHARNQEVHLFWDTPAIVTGGDDDSFVFQYEYR